VYKLKELNYDFLDCQVHTSHLETLGARYISRDEFLNLLTEGLTHETLRGNWRYMPEFN
jgi:leucyl/phenylalanyl-tRNA--protein transferase